MGTSMAISSEEQKLQDETRTALLQAIKSSADHLRGNSGSIGGASLKDLAEAYAIVVETRKPSSGAHGG